jgi:hypothetical protein
MVWDDVVNEWRWGFDYTGGQMIHDTQRGLPPHRVTAAVDVVRSYEMTASLTKFRDSMR